MNIVIQVLSTNIETKQTTKGSYQQLEVAYKDLTQGGKVTARKLMSFTNKAVFDRMATAKATDIFEVAMEKDDKGYWNWKEVKRGEAPAQSATAPSSQPSARTSTSSNVNVRSSTYETPEERSQKQVYIIRQSSISAAVNALSVGAKTPPKAVEVIEYAKELEAFVFGKTIAEVISKDIGSIEDIDEDPLPF